MNRDEKRESFKKLKAMKPAEFWSAMNVLHTRAYAAAERHFGEAMDIVLQPKQKAAVVAKAEQIRVLWDGMRTLDTDQTEAELFQPREEQNG